MLGPFQKTSKSQLPLGLLIQILSHHSRLYKRPSATRTNQQPRSCTSHHFSIAPDQMWPPTNLHATCIVFCTAFLLPLPETHHWDTARLDSVAPSKPRAPRSSQPVGRRGYAQGVPTLNSWSTSHQPSSCRLAPSHPSVYSSLCSPRSQVWQVSCFALMSFVFTQSSSEKCRFWDGFLPGWAGWWWLIWLQTSWQFARFSRCGWLWFRICAVKLLLCTLGPWKARLRGRGSHVILLNSGSPHQVEPHW